MSDPIEAWVDSRELRRIGELLMSPTEAAEPQSDEAAYGEGFEGFGRAEGAGSQDSAGVGQARQASSRLAEARRLAEEGGLLASAKSKKVATAAPSRGETRPAETVTGPGLFLGRMEAFGNWLRQEVGAEAFFLIDRTGEIFVDEIGEERLVGVAQTLALASQAANRQVGTEVVGGLRVKISGERHLEILPTETHYGFLILGLRVTGTLPSATAEIVVQGLQRAVAPPQNA